MRILVTGASGLLGKLSVAVATASGRHSVSGLGRSALDILDENAVERALSDVRPDAVLHCAAETDVDRAETSEPEVMEVNARGAARLAGRAHAAGARFVYVSSNFVFDGTAKKPYREEDEPRPLSVYGRSKIEGERLVAQAAPGGHLIVRTGWLYGPGKGFVDWARERLVAGRDLPLVEDQIGSPTAARELASAMLSLVEKDLSGLFHFVNRGEASWLDLGRAVAEELALDPSPIRPISARELGRPAARPAYSVLSVERFERETGERVRHWREALSLYLAGRSGAMGN